MSSVTFADVVHYSVNFSREEPAEALVLKLIDNPWVQRLRDISQTANTRLVYMFSEHSRFGHSVGVAYMAKLLLNSLLPRFPEQVLKYKTAILAAALLHDLGHIAPGSHTASKSWFPGKPDSHERLTVKVIKESESLSRTVSEFREGLLDEVVSILEESRIVPPWTWEIISGGGWNIDRGNWCIVDSIMAGVSYGQYNIPALTDAITIGADRHLALNENRLDAMLHFVVSRHAMYRQIYHHRVMLAADTLDQAIVRRARDLGGNLPFADSTMTAALAAESPDDLALADIFEMRESWWRYHLSRWAKGSDKILADLSRRLLDRALLKTVRISSTDEPGELTAEAAKAVEKAGYDPRYYLHLVSIENIHGDDIRNSMHLQMDDGRIVTMSEAEPLINALSEDSESGKKAWLVMPQEAKALLNRRR